MGILDSFSVAPDGDSDLTPRERKALFDENNRGPDTTQQVVADRAREAESSALEKRLGL
jgi:hypothetical protein